MKLARLRPGPAERHEPIPDAVVMRGLDGVPVARIRPDADSTRLHSSGQSELLAWYISGTLFLKEDGREVAPGMDVARLALELPERFVERYWGHYRVIVHDRWRGTTLVLCDPCGHCPTYYRFCHDGAVHVAADPAALVDDHPSFDSLALKSFLVHGDLGGVQCALYDVERLPLGHALWIPERGAPQTRVVWWPDWRMTDQDAQTAASGEGLLRLLRRSVERSVGDRPAVLELSGGVESTSLALALAESGRADTCTAINHRDPSSPSSDESHHAGSVARHVRMAFERLDIDYAAFSPSPSSAIPRLARPALHLCMLAQLDAVRERLSAYSGHRLVNGHGGDAIFLAPPPNGAFLDAFADGQWRRAFSAWRDLAVMQRLPLWWVAQGAFAQLGQRHANPDAALSTGLLTPAARIADTPRTEPLASAWLSRWTLRVRPGKRAQILGILGNLRDVEVQPSLAAAGTAFPFLTQPVVEAGLKMPTYRLFNAMHNRLPLRRAAYLASGLPNLWRRDKGVLTGMVGAGAAANLAHIEEVCLDGYCAASGWIDRDACRRAIGRMAHHHLESMTTIRRLYAIEMFVRGWRAGAV